MLIRRFHPAVMLWHHRQGAKCKFACTIPAACSGSELNVHLSPASCRCSSTLASRPAHNKTIKLSVHLLAHQS